VLSSPHNVGGEPKHHPVPLGIGNVSSGSSESFFIACCYPFGQVARDKLGLSSPRHFHVTLGFNPNDVHDVPKDLSTIIYPQTPQFLLPHAQKFLKIGSDVKMKLSDRKHFLKASMDVCQVALKGIELGFHVSDDGEEIGNAIRSCLSEAELMLKSDPNSTCPINHIYLDLDGVLADFDGGVRALTGNTPKEMKSSEMWKHICRCKWKNGFFGSLDWVEDGKALWLILKKFWPLKNQLSLLTGLPRGGHSWASGQKKKWCSERLIGQSGGNYKEVICCMAAEKKNYARPDALLIDDRISNCEEWGAAGGVFIHHTSFENTHDQLVSLGVVVSPVSLEK
jgi:hypothetical protein